MASEEITQVHLVPRGTAARLWAARLYAPLASTARKDSCRLPAGSGIRASPLSAGRPIGQMDLHASSQSHPAIRQTARISGKGTAATGRRATVHVSPSNYGPGDPGGNVGGGKSGGSMGSPSGGGGGLKGGGGNSGSGGRAPSGGGMRGPR